MADASRFYAACWEEIEKDRGEFMKLKRLIFLILGFVCLGLGCVGIALPILPTVPFFLVTVFCFANSSQKLHDWFVGTKMYKKHLESFVKKKGMTVQTKVGIIIPVTLLMGFGFFYDDAGGYPDSQHHPCHRLGVPYHLFCVWSQDDQNCCKKGKRTKWMMEGLLIL